jgi:hypothetical protein
MISQGYYAPPEEWCRANHHHSFCRLSPGYYVPPEYANVDVNDPARQAQVNDCMYRLGYELGNAF